MDFTFSYIAYNNSSYLLCTGLGHVLGPILHTSQVLTHFHLHDSLTYKSPPYIDEETEAQKGGRLAQGGSSQHVVCRWERPLFTSATTFLRVQ